jgi:ornithine--oxo-acid transaminase
VTATVPPPTDTASSVAVSHTARNYAPLPVTLVSGEGSWVTDVDGHCYLDLLSAYSALNFGHRHPRLVAAAHAQLDRLTLTSRAFDTELLDQFTAALADLCGKEAVLTMNTGAEAVESAIKIARRWGYTVKGVPRDEARIVVCSDNFHGRTTTIVGFSTDDTARADFGPFTPGFDTVPYGDAGARVAAIEDRTVAVLVEPIQGEAGVMIPPDGYLTAVARACRENNVLFMADEIQSGLGRTGRTFACDHEGVQPDLYILGKALGGGILPLSAVVGDWSVIGVLEPGSHGSTFGGNPLAAAVGLEVVAMLATGEHQDRAAELAPRFAADLSDVLGDRATTVRTRGLWAGIDLAPDGPTGRALCQAMVAQQVLAKDTHGHTVRLSPPLTISDEDLDLAVAGLGRALDSLTG